ncbi:L-iditol 2-dehydrogenase [Actinopolyspora mzabensis]|uniref:L-iditol 2-dehydrogenase n=1 Tax=Actinopolyspora mzabensis TaxID=995066 RepID=A0A1G9A1C5_ACTMZ|nr:alcohol dehydrogenase catalytic domain-containing protein [Actinopolyspora mzabensis]SDK21061.1 L-iditol 2-dehydrogenase [Actinopolyspora mzabensis]
MTAAVLTAVETMRTRTVAVPAPRADELLVRVVETGICGSDVAAYRGLHPYKRPPVVLGHELSGVVETVGEKVTGFAVGDRVCSAAYSPCGACQECARGAVHLCRARSNLSHDGWQGSFAQYVVLRANSTFRLDDTIGFTSGALVEPLAIGLHAARLIRHEMPRLLVLGTGNIGLTCLTAARRLGATEVLCADIGADKGERAHALGSDGYIDTREGPPPSQRRLADHPVDVTIVATGYEGVLDDALAVTRPGGQVIVVSYFDHPHALNLNDWVSAEVTLDFSALATPEDFRTVLAWLASGQIDPAPMVTDRFSLRTASEAFELLETASPHVGKILLETPDSTAGLED